MLLVDDILVMDIARKNKRISRVAAIHNLSMDDTICSISSRIGREKFFSEFQKGYQESDDF